MNREDEPVARRTRSQTAARRTEEAETAARQRAINEETDRLARERERSSRIQQSFPRTGPHDVVANFTDATRASVIAAQTGRIEENLENEIQRIRNANVSTMERLLIRPVSRQTSTTARRYAERRRQIIEARQIMDVNVSSLYNLRQDIYAYLNTEQMLYFTRNSITDNYFFRRLELSYGIPTIDKFNQICQNIIDNIPADANIIALDYTYDIDYYCQIVNFLEQINTQFTLVSNKTELKALLIGDLTNSILNEKEIVYNLIIHLNNVLQTLDPSQNAVSASITSTLNTLNIRYHNLNSITHSIIQQHFKDSEFEKIRIYSLYILQAAITLCKIFLLLIINLYNIQNITIIAEKRRKYGEIIINMYDAIANFTYIMSTSSSDTDELELLITFQNTLYENIINTLSEIDREHSLRVEDIIEIYNNHRTPLFRIVYNINRPIPQNDLHSLTYELLIPPIPFRVLSRGQRRTRIQSAQITSLLNAYRVNNRQRARQLRNDAIMQRRREIEAARAARAAREQQQREARAAARAARGQSGTSSAPRAPRASRASRISIIASSQIPHSILTSAPIILNMDEMFDVDPRADATYTRTFLDTSDTMYKTDSTSLLNKLKDKYILYSKDFKTNSDKVLVFNDFKSKFKTTFNDDEPAPRIDSIENYVGNSIASLFSRYVYYSDMKFNDLSRYFVINYTLERRNSVPSGPSTGEYRRIRQAGVDAGGLRRDFITALTSELFEKKILITREGTKKYYLNPFYVPDEEFGYIVGSKS